MDFRRLAKALCYAAWIALAVTAGTAQADEPAVTPYGAESPDAPPELRLFSFLVGRWEGTERAPLADGTVGEVKSTWIGRYILDGMAIAHELHAEASDGSSYRGMSFFYFDPASRAWTVEFLNITGSFLRRQVDRRSGAVTQEGNAIVVTDTHGERVAREEYRLTGEDRFSYALLMSDDGGKTWGKPAYQYTLTRTE